MKFAKAAIAACVVVALPVQTLAAKDGKSIAFDRNKGNCLACHTVADGEQPGNSAPPLVMMKVRYPERERLHKQIWDAAELNPQTVMPPYGRHHILTEDEMDLVVDYIHSL